MELGGAEVELRWSRGEPLDCSVSSRYTKVGMSTSRKLRPKAQLDRAREPLRAAADRTLRPAVARALPIARTRSAHDPESLRSRRSASAGAQRRSGAGADRTERRGRSRRDSRRSARERSKVGARGSSRTTGRETTRQVGRAADTPFHGQLAELVRVARSRADLTQRALAERVGTTQPVIARLERAAYAGHSLAALRRVAAALGLELELRFRRVATPTPRRASSRRRRKRRGDR